MTKRNRLETQKNNQRNQKDDKSIDEMDKRVYNINIINERGKESNDLYTKSTD